MITITHATINYRCRYYASNLNDPAQSWIYVDPHKSELLSLIHRNSRIERWLYSGLHSLDFAFWYHQRPLWDLGVLILLAGGLGVSFIGLCYGIKRLKNDIIFILKKITGKEKINEVNKCFTLKN